MNRHSLAIIGAGPAGYTLAQELVKTNAFDIDIFEKEGLQKYESEYILCFLKNVVLTYIGQRVRLTNGQEGDVVFINPQQFSRPMVKCGDTFIDLSKQKDITIERLL